MAAVVMSVYTLNLLIFLNVYACCHILDAYATTEEIF
jgi:hypothetical protein